MSFKPEKRPEVSTELAATLAKEHFGLKILKIKEFDSYSDRNFYLKTQDGEFVLKVTNSEETANLPLVEAQNNAMLFLKSEGVNCSVPQISLSKNLTVVKELKPNKPHNAVRLFDFVRGQMVEDVASFTCEMIYSLGQFVGKIDISLKNFSHAALNDDTKVNFDLQQIHIVEHLIKAKYLSSKDREDMILGIYNQYMTIVKPALKNITKQVIHNDISSFNLFVQPDMQTFSIIDFGDITYSYRIFEVAIIMGDLILNQYIKGIESFCEYAGILLNGYQSIYPLSELELSLLYWCIAARFMQLLVIGSVKICVEPDNKYVIEKEIRIWEFLPKYLEIGDRQLLERWLQM